jgi:hypothetical protein
MESRLLPRTWCRAHHGRVLARTLSILAYAVIALALAIQGVVVPPAAKRSDGDRPTPGAPTLVPWNWDFETEEEGFPAGYEPMMPEPVPNAHEGPIFEA